MAFSSAAYEVNTAEDGLGGITQATAVRPQVILLDLMMPGMDGFEVLEALKKNVTTFKSTIVITSNLADPQHVQRALDSGADMFIKKADFTPYETVREVEQHLQGGQSAENLLSSQEPVKPKVLLIEDNADQADIVVLSLQSHGLQTLMADTGQKGVELAVKERPHLILLDLMLPDISGFQVLEELRKTAKLAVPVIVTSQLIEQKDRRKAERLGAAGFLNKTEYPPEQMAEKVLDYLEADLMA